MTDTDHRPRRTALYMPGANDKALEKAKGLACDAIIFDTEDSVAPDMKAEARAKVAAAVTSGAYGHRELTIRVNSIDTEWHEADLRSAAEAAPAGHRRSQDQLRGRRRGGRAGTRVGRRAGPHPAVGDARDARSDGERGGGGDQFRAAGGPRDGYQRSRQGTTGGSRARSSAAAVGSGALRQRRPLRRQGHPRWCVQRRSRPRGLRGGVRSGRRDGLRRQDDRAPLPGGSVQRGLRSLSRGDRVLTAGDRGVRRGCRARARAW